MGKRTDPVEPAGRATLRWRDLRLVGVAVAAIVLVWFALGNLHQVGIEFWISRSRAPLIVVIAISGLLGALIATLFGRHRSAGR